MQLSLYDTTLRDGAQTEGISFSAEDKLRIAERLDAYGAHYIEGGFPGSNPKDREFFTRAAERTWKHARITAFGATRYKGARAEADDNLQALLACETPTVTIVAKFSRFQAETVLETSPDENLAMIRDSVAYLKKCRPRSHCRRRALLRRPRPRSRLCGAVRARGRRRRLAGALRHQWRIPAVRNPGRDPGGQ